MIVQCRECQEMFDDLDHLTFCPHDLFVKPPKRVVEIIGAAVVEDRPLTVGEQHELDALGYGDRDVASFVDRFRRA